MAASVLTEGKIRFNSSLYPEATLDAARAAYSQFLDMTIEVQDRDWLVSIAPRPGAGNDSLVARREFLNYVLDLALQSHLKPS